MRWDVEQDVEDAEGLTSYSKAQHPTEWDVGPNMQKHFETLKTSYAPSHPMKWPLHTDITMIGLLVAFFECWIVWALVVSSGVQTRRVCVWGGDNSVFGGCGNSF